MSSFACACLEQQMVDDITRCGCGQVLAFPCAALCSFLSCDPT